MSIHILHQCNELCDSLDLFFVVCGVQKICLQCFNNIKCMQIVQNALPVNTML